jgi:hypothetical protein
MAKIHAPRPGSTMLDPIAEEPPRADPPAKKSPKRSNRFEEINGFVDVTMRELNRAELAVWLILWRDTKPNGEARASQADIARRGGLKTRMVRYALTRLQELGLLVVVDQGRLGKGCSTYRVLAAK